MGPTGPGVHPGLEEEEEVGMMEDGGIWELVSVVAVCGFEREFSCR